MNDLPMNPFGTLPEEFLRKRYADYVAYFTASNPEQMPMAYEHWIGARTRQERDTANG